MQLTPETAGEIHRIFDDPIPANDEVGDVLDVLDETRFVDDELYGPRAPRLVEVRALLAWLDADAAAQDDDAYDRM